MACWTDNDSHLQASYAQLKFIKDYPDLAGQLRQMARAMA
jgi:2-oxo-4-hydroxy-4-carboxy--5-ureidoimidazoline (OHCU) decarboxylase